MHIEVCGLWHDLRHGLHLGSLYGPPSSLRVCPKGTTTTTVHTQNLGTSSCSNCTTYCVLTEGEYSCQAAPGTGATAALAARLQARRVAWKFVQVDAQLALRVEAQRAVVLEAQAKLDAERRRPSSATGGSGSEGGSSVDSELEAEMMQDKKAAEIIVSVFMDLTMNK